MGGGLIILVLNGISMFGQVLILAHVIEGGWEVYKINYMAMDVRYFRRGCCLTA